MKEKTDIPEELITVLKSWKDVWQSKLVFRIKTSKMVYAIIVNYAIVFYCKHVFL